MLDYLNYSRQIAGWEEELRWCARNFRDNGSNTQMKKVMLNATIYYLWIERNSRLYQQQHCSGSELAKGIYNDARLKFSAEDLIIDDNTANRQLFGRWKLEPLLRTRTPIMCSWKKPPTGWYKLNTDGSLRGLTGGFGAVIRDDQGDIVAACAGSTSGHTILKHELQGVEAGLQLARLRNLMKLVISTDSIAVRDYLIKSRQVAWDLRHTVNNIRGMLGILEEYTMRHEYREANRVADRLASLNPSLTFVKITPSSFAQDLKDIVHEDKSGKTYLRM